MIIGVPLYCDIPEKIEGVELEFRFDGETDFSVLPIYENENKSEPGFYNDKENYVHLQTFMFRQFISKYNESEKTFYDAYYA